MDTKQLAPTVRTAVEHVVDRVEPTAARVAPVVRTAVERAVEHAIDPAAERVRPVVQSAVDSAVAHATDVAKPAAARVRPAIRTVKQRRGRTGTRRPAWKARAVIGTGVALAAGLVAWSIVWRRAAQREAALAETMPDRPVAARRESSAAAAHTG